MDFDGEQGVSVLQDWIKQYGTEWTQTRRVKTYRGEQLWFLWPTGERIRNSAGKIAPGVDVRAEGGYVVVPPSIHPKGPVYTFADPSAPIAEAPPWLVEIPSKPHANSNPARG